MQTNLDILHNPQNESVMIQLFWYHEWQILMSKFLYYFSYVTSSHYKFWNSSNVTSKYKCCLKMLGGEIGIKEISYEKKDKNLKLVAR